MTRRRPRRQAGGFPRSVSSAREDDVRVDAGFSRLLRLDGIWVGRLSSSLIGSRSRSRCGVDGCAARCASTRRRTGTTASRSSRPGAIWISAFGDWRSAPGCVGWSARSTACGSRASRSHATAPGSRATSSNSSPGLRPVPTRRRSPGWCGSTGTRSGGSSPACALMSSTATGWRTCSRSGSTR